MSWSINLNGKKQVVFAELRNSIIQLQQGLETLQNTDSEAVQFSACGSVSVNQVGGISIGSSHNVTAVAPPVPVAVDPGKLTVMEVPVPGNTLIPDPPAAS